MLEMLCILSSVQRTLNSDIEEGDFFIMLFPGGYPCRAREGRGEEASEEEQEGQDARRSRPEEEGNQEEDGCQ